MHIQSCFVFFLCIKVSFFLFQFFFLFESFCLFTSLPWFSVTQTQNNLTLFFLNLSFDFLKSTAKCNNTYARTHARTHTHMQALKMHTQILQNNFMIYFYEFCVLILFYYIAQILALQKFEFFCLFAILFWKFAAFQKLLWHV